MDPDYILGVTVVGPVEELPGVGDLLDFWNGAANVNKFSQILK